MIRLLFSLRFRSQLRRTRPDLVGGLEKFIVRAVEVAGGSPKNERRLLTSSFDENALGVWLDILLLIENILNSLNDAAEDLYGYTMVIGRDIQEEDGEELCRQLAGRTDGLSGKSKGGVWCDQAVQQALGYYLYFEKPQSRPDDGADEAVGGVPAGEYVRLKGIKSLPDLRANAYPLRDAIVTAMRQGGGRNMLLVGPEYSGTGRPVSIL
jgi:hypothetical protein